ncbi:MAG: UDP-N-acetylmuramoyl-L-alanine--D-glutamate ligase [Armatimonadetes bacterium]|nr:UDP-N-acetylmuramoyl-L-alanine--D-glutamate ligase [Anaerolineae bacterium]
MFNNLQGDILTGRRVLIIGFARQGQALARWLPTVGARGIVTDSKSAEQLGIDPADYPRTRFYLGIDQAQSATSLAALADVVCVSGGVPLDNPIIRAAQVRGLPLTNDAQFFVDRCPAPIIGITGSAGKTTTTTLVGEMFKRAGVTTWVGGNIGNVLLDVMMGIRPEHQVVMELSSFQLELMFTSPPIAAVLNITPNHLDRHGTMQNYIRAKANIVARQRAEGLVILGRDDWGARMVENVTPGSVLWFSRNEIVADGAFLVGQRLFVSGLASSNAEPQHVCEVDEIPLRGEHNVSNVLAACAIAGAAGLEPDVMRETILMFKAVPHRLETVREIDGVTYVNDSIATAPERVIAALRSYDEPLILLAGGADKKLPWDEMIVLALQKARHIIAFGRDGDIVVNTARKFNAPPDTVTRVETLDEAVALAALLAQPGDVVLLSPGGTSYDAYQDFAQRGEHFRTLVHEL